MKISMEPNSKLADEIKAKSRDGTIKLVKIRITCRYDDVLGEVREIQFIYDNGGVIGMPYDDFHNTKEFDVPFAKAGSD